MEGWLKGLIAAACVVVIAGGGYFAIAEYRSSQEREAVKAAADRRAMVAACKQMVKDLSNNDTKDYKNAAIATCINGGYVTEKEFRDGGAGPYLDRVSDILKPPAQ